MAPARVPAPLALERAAAELGVDSALLGGVYLVLIVRSFGDGGGGGFGSLAEVRTLFENPWALLAGWIHYLAFDLFIGAWEVRDAQRNGLHHLLVVPCLVLTFMLGPVGLLLYLVLRGAITRRVWLGKGARPERSE